jgi:hypothetical protein
MTNRAAIASKYLKIRKAYLDPIIPPIICTFSIAFIAAWLVVRF